MLLKLNEEKTEIGALSDTAEEIQSPVEAICSSTTDIDGADMTPVSAGNQCCGCKSLPNHQVIFSRPIEAAAVLGKNRTLVCLVRHGVTDWNQTCRLQGRVEVPLNDEGRAQAAHAAETLSTAVGMGLGVVRLYSSPLSRAYNTAQYISQALDVHEITVLTRLNERDYAGLTGLTFEQRKALYPKGEREVKNIERVPESGIRMTRAIAEIQKLSGTTTSVAVTHGGVINALFYYLTNGKIGTGRNISKNCGVSLVAAGEHDVIPLAYNLYGDEFTGYIGRLCRVWHRE